MLIRFTLENWMSFGQPVEFSMVAGRERQHGARVPRVSKYPVRVLPIAAIYGGNASGKTNFFRALNFARMLVVRGTQPDSLIAIEPFRLDRTIAERPSRFGFELLVGEDIYAYDFAVTRREVVEERLVRITATGEKTLFDRKGREPNFDPSLASSKFLEFAFKGTRANQLFVTNSVSQGLDDFRPVHDWFRDTLDLVAPDARFEPFEHFIDESASLMTDVNNLLPGLDTGIARLGGEEVAFETLALPEPFRIMLQESVQEGETVRLALGSQNDRVVVSRNDGNLIAKRLVTYHSASDGSDVKFDMKHESDGSLRVIDLLPAFFALTAPNSRRVFVIDELDRSLHTLLTRRLLEAYLESCGPETRAQMLFTTHDVLLMDQDLLRRDEMWVAERSLSGNSTMTSFSEYKDVRNDKDLRKSYLQGRLGGIPRLLLHGTGSTQPVMEP